MAKIICPVCRQEGPGRIHLDFSECIADLKAENARLRQERDKWQETADDWQQAVKKIGRKLGEMVERKGLAEDRADVWQERAEKAEIGLASLRQTYADTACELVDERTKREEAKKQLSAQERVTANIEAQRAEACRLLREADSALTAANVRIAELERVLTFYASTNTYQPSEGGYTTLPGEVPIDIDQGLRARKVLAEKE